MTVAMYEQLLTVFASSRPAPGSRSDWTGGGSVAGPARLAAGTGGPGAAVAASLGRTRRRVAAQSG